MTVFSDRQKMFSFKWSGGIMNRRNFSHTIRNVRMQAVAGGDSTAPRCHLWPRTLIFLLHPPQCTAYCLMVTERKLHFLVSHPCSPSFDHFTKTKRHPINLYPPPSPPDDSLPFGNRTVSQAHVKLQERFSTLCGGKWWGISLQLIHLIT